MPPDTPTQTISANDYVALLATQRNEALNKVIEVMAQNAALTREIEKLRAHLPNRAERRATAKAAARTPARKATAPRKR